jgi:hypothetical protein
MFETKMTMTALAAIVLAAIAATTPGAQAKGGSFHGGHAGGGHRGGHGIAVGEPHPGSHHRGGHHGRHYPYHSRYSYGWGGDYDGGYIVSAYGEECRVVFSEARRRFVRVCY